MDFLVRRNLLNPYQHGFLKARLCLTNMLCFLEEITNWIDEGSPVGIIIFRKLLTKSHIKDYYLNKKLMSLGMA